MESTELISARETAKRLHVTYGGLAVARCKQRWKLPYVRIGRKIFYKPEDIQAFIDAQTYPGDGPRRTGNGHPTRGRTGRRASVSEASA
jgi:hypothetical protein